MDGLDLRDLTNRAREHLQDRFAKTKHDWVDIGLSPNGAAMVTVVSDQFLGLSREEREKLVRTAWSEIGGNTLEIIWLTVVAQEEAETIELTPPDRFPRSVGSWLDFAYAVLNAEPKPAEMPLKKSRVVVFYSYKGGVGRTTAMLQVAYLLAQQGRRIVLVDMDLEAPGLRHAVEHLDPDPEQGLVDYLYERQLLLRGAAPDIQVKDIVGRVRSELPMRGDLYVVPAGHVDLDYIGMVDDLDTWVGGSSPEAWTVFLQELSEQLEPDLIFVDSRTGFNRWGAVSLLLLADEAFVFAYPNRQNLEGLRPLLSALKGFGRPPVTVVFSMVPPTQEGHDLIEKYWAQTAPLLDLPEAPTDQGDATARGRPVTVFYNPAIATASHLPLAKADAYRPLAERLGDIAEEASHVQAFVVDVDLGLDETRRWKLVESIHIPIPFAEREFNPRLFQPMEILPEILKPEVSLIRGRKGTGKSFLFRMFQTGDMRQLAKDAMQGVWILPAHGLGVPSPDAAAFQGIAAQIEKTPGLTWELFWSSHALLRLWIDEGIRRYGPRLTVSHPIVEPYRRILGKIPQQQHGGRWEWTSTHTEVVLMLAHSEAGQQYRNLLSWMDESPKRSARRHRATVWLLYDNLEFDLPDWASFWPAALEGLFRFVSSLDERSISWLRPKVFLREDLWQRLKFANKTHFHDRQVELRWQRIDLLRLAYRLLTQSGAITEFLQEHYKIPNVDQIDEEALMNALGLVWGLRRARTGNAQRVHEWLYERMTDASGTTYPREMIHLLQESCAAELGFREDKHVPVDRLLRAEALDNGLRYASKKRCTALRAEEYQALAPFFDGLQGLPAKGRVTIIQDLWRRTAKDIETNFEIFLNLLISIGLLNLDRESREGAEYQFADIYIDGFGLARVPGQPV